MTRSRHRQNRSRTSTPNRGETVHASGRRCPVADLRAEPAVTLPSIAITTRRDAPFRVPLSRGTRRSAVRRRGFSGPRGASVGPRQWGREGGARRLHGHSARHRSARAGAEWQNERGVIRKMEEGERWNANVRWEGPLPSPPPRRNGEHTMEIITAFLGASADWLKPSWIDRDEIRKALPGGGDGGGRRGAALRRPRVAPLSRPAPVPYPARTLSHPPLATTRSLSPLLLLPVRSVSLCPTKRDRGLASRSYLLFPIALVLVPPSISVSASRSLVGSSSCRRGRGASPFVRGGKLCHARHASFGA